MNRNLLSATVLTALALALIPSAAHAADPVLVLPPGDITDIAVSDVAARVFLAQPSTQSVIVTDLDGAHVSTVTGISGARQLTARPSGKAIFASAPGGAEITRINTETLNTRSYPLPAGQCVRWTHFTGGALWFSYRACQGGLAGLGVLEPSTGAITLHPATEHFLDRLTGQASRPGRVISLEVGSSGAPLQAWDLRTVPPTLVAMHWPQEALSNCAEGAPISNGTLVVIACGAPYAHQVINTADATIVGTLPSDTYPNSVATSADGRYVALGVNGIYWPDVYVQDLAGGVPGTPVTNFDFPEGVGLRAGALAWGADGRLYAVCEGRGTGDALYVLNPLNP